MKRMKKLLCILLALLMLISCLTACGKQEEPEQPQETPKPVQPQYELTDAEVSKEETVYINLSPDGTVKKVSVTDRLHTAMPQVRIEDKSDLESITDVKTFLEPVLENGRMYWDMQSTDLYYNGTSEKTPPLAVSLSYTLDGNKTDYSELAGKSGEVTVNISVKNTLTKKVSVGGKSYTLQCPMLLLCGMILPDEGFENVTADKGVILGDGSHKVIVFMGVPGMNESLGLKDIGLDFIGDTLGGNSYTLTAKAENFALGNIMLAAVPFSSVRTLGFKDISVGVDGFKDMLTDLEGLMSAFSSLALDDIIQILYGDAAQLERLINAVGDAAELYEKNRALIEVLNKYVNDGNLRKLEKVLEDMESLNTDAISSLAGFKPFSQLMELLGMLDKNIRGIAELTSDYLDIIPLFDSLKSDLEAAGVKDAFDDLPQTLEKLRSLIGVLHDSEELLNKTVKLFDSEGMRHIKDFAEKLTGSESLNALTAAQREGLTGRMMAWLELGESYDIFTQRTEKQSSSVVFVYKTEAIG